MKWIGHKEFGPNYSPFHEKDITFDDDLNINHWLEQWNLTYKDCYENFKNKENIYFICYEKLCSSSEYWLYVLQILNIKDNTIFNLKSYKVTSHEMDEDLIKGLSLCRKQSIS